MKKSFKDAVPYNPQRTCVGCHAVRAKRELVRIVRTPDGAVEVDETGRKAGRGAYLCKARDCWEAGLSKRALDHVLKSGLSAEQRDQLLFYAKKLPEGSDKSC